MTKKHKIRSYVKRVVPKRRKSEQDKPAASESVPRITNETVAAHREEVLSSARKYIYPLQHSKHRIVLVSTALVLLAVVVFFVYCVFALYRFEHTSTFVYRVTQVIPFPIAKAGPRFVAYENYLFELRRYMHYYETQQQVDFDSESGQQQLAEYKKRALDSVVNDAYIKQLAEELDLTVSDREVDDAIAMLRNQNRLGAGDEVFSDVLKNNFGWTVGEYKRHLKGQILEQKVVSALDKETHQAAEDTLRRLRSGDDFAAVAAAASEDPGTKDNGGEYPFLIDQNTPDVPPQVTDVLFGLEPGEVSDIINTGYALEIVKHLAAEGDSIKAAHIQFNFNEILQYLNDRKEVQPARLYLRLTEE